MRSLAKEESKAYHKRLDDQKKEVSNARYEYKSKSYIKRLKAKHHNENRIYNEQNKIVILLGRIFTELHTPIEGSLNEINKS